MKTLIEILIDTLIDEKVIDKYCIYQNKNAVQVKLINSKIYNLMCVEITDKKFVITKLKK